jgi:hypothetical protein
MNKKALCFAVALTAALWGCASAQQQPDRPPQGKPLKPVATVPGPYPQDRYSAAYCERDLCAITVKIDAKCEISVDPQWMGISSRVNAPELKWILDAPPGYSIDVFNKPERSSVKDTFMFERVSPTEIRARVRKTNAPAVYQYGITATRAGKICETLDPPVIVDM